MYIFISLLSSTNNNPRFIQLRYMFFFFFFFYLYLIMYELNVLLRLEVMYAFM